MACGGGNVKRSIVFSIEALLSLLAAVAFISYAGAGGREASYREAYAYQLTQDILEVAAKSPAIRGKVLEWNAGAAGAEGWLRAKFAKISQALGGRCILLRLEGKSIAVGCEKGMYSNGMYSTRIAGERIFFDGSRFFVLEVETRF